MIRKLKLYGMAVEASSIARFTGYWDEMNTVKGNITHKVDNI